MANISETETVVKKIVPYLQRRSYDLEKHLTFEYPAKNSARGKLGFVDILVRKGNANAFLIEAKKIAKRLTDRDRKQALRYGNDCNVPFVVLTNGDQFECLNTASGERIRWNGVPLAKIPSSTELPTALATFKKNKFASDVPLSGDSSLPFRPGLPLKQLNGLFAKAHNTIRKIEKDEDNAFADFAKLLFLKLLEEKADTEQSDLPYSYRFHQLAERTDAEADQVKSAILSMLSAIREKTPYGDVLHDQLHLKNPKTYQNIVRQLAAVSFRDSRTDSKGAAFEYFVRATLKGKKLGQYFTPRPVIELMHAMVGEEKVAQTLTSASEMRVVDPACGTGGFLVYMLLSSIEAIEQKYKEGKLTREARDKVLDKLKVSTFFGADANPGVASSAKMNMIIAGDGHSNIQCEDTLQKASSLWDTAAPNIDLIITNPPFGTSEAESLSPTDRAQFPVGGSRGQVLFLQKMIQAVKPGGEICTVIDEGLLNTEQASELREFILENTRIKGIVRLPDVTFKPNKINVRSSILHLVKRDEIDADLSEDYQVFFCDVVSLGYLGSGEVVRKFDFQESVDEFACQYHGSLRETPGADFSHPNFRVFTRNSLDIAADATKRFDLKYWLPEITLELEQLHQAGAKSIKELNQIETKRGRSPTASSYVDEEDGHALVIKAGSNISRNGEIIFSGDFVEKSLFDQMDSVHLVDGDVLLSSTGDGTLGKCAVYRGKKPAIFDGHVTRIRVDQASVYPEYLCDYLRAGFGSDQVQRLYTGSTGLIELPPERVDEVLIDLPGLPEQKKMSKGLRDSERLYAKSLDEAAASLRDAQSDFRS